MKPGVNAALKAWCFVLIFAFSLAMSSSAADETYIITLKADSDPEKVAKEFKLKPKHLYRHALKGFALPLDADELKKLRKDKRVLAVGQDAKVVLCGQTIPNGINRMGLTNFPLARINGLDERIDVDVAVLDTGIQTNHPDLNVVQAVDVTGGGYNGDDQEGHGTMMAGIIGALDNDIGVVGVAPGVRLWSVQHSIDAIGSFSDTLAGMEYIATNAQQIEVVNASFVNFVLLDTNVYVAVHQAVSNLVNLGIVFVAAAGNDGKEISGFDRIPSTSDDVVPAGLPGVMAVSGMDPIADMIWEAGNFSLFGKTPSYVTSPGLAIDVTAPAVNVLSTDKGTNYATGTGTSAATAHVTGLVALYIAANGRATNAEGVYRIRQAIVDSGQPQSQWRVGDSDPDGNPEPLAVASPLWLPQQILPPQRTTAGFELSFTTAARFVYTLQATDSLSDSNIWVNLVATNGTGQLVTLVDSAPGAMRFYRLVRTPFIPSPTTNVYEWTFAAGNLSPALGNGVLAYADAATSNLTVFATTDGTNVPHISGQPASYMAVPQMPSPAGGYRVNLTASGPNGGGHHLNQYSIIQDVLIPAPRNWTALFNTDPNNNNSAELYLDANGQLAYPYPVFLSGWRRDGSVPTDTWVRLAFVADLHSTFGLGPGDGTNGFRLFVDGTLVHYSSDWGWRDGTFSISLKGIQPGDLRLFNEGAGAGYTHPIYVSAWALVDRALTTNEVAALGGPKTSGIFTPGP